MEHSHRVPGSVVRFNGDNDVSGVTSENWRIEEVEETQDRVRWHVEVRRPQAEEDDHWVGDIEEKTAET